jgi:hypothetical protein
MKQLTRNILLRISLLLMVAMNSVIALAQEKGVDIDVNVKKEGDWYSKPWVWVVGGAIFILLLVALLRGGSRRSA